VVVLSLISFARFVNNFNKFRLILNDNEDGRNFMRWTSLVRDY
jgi:hypothetical protein